MGRAHERFLDLALHASRPVADEVEKRGFNFYRHVAVVVLREVVDDGVTELDLLVRELRTRERAALAPEVVHDVSKLDVGLHMDYISPPKASIHLEHDAVPPIDVSNLSISDVLVVPIESILVLADNVCA